MTDIAGVAAIIDTTVRDIARQTAALATGLQNAAPGNNTSSNSIQYLFAITKELQAFVDKVQLFIGSYQGKETHEQRDALIALVREMVAQDKQLREQYQIGDKFRFIRDKLTTVLAQAETDLMAAQVEKEKKAVVVAEDEMLVFVYLYNAQGLIFNTWQKMITPKVFYEYSVNRPIYSEKAHIETLIRTKPNRIQHGYLAVAIKKTEILPITDDEPTKDANDNPVLKIREGSLRIERLFAFIHNEHEYILDEEGELIRKT